MKKTRKLQFNKEAVRDLTDESVKHVAGASTASNCFECGTAWSDCNSCVTCGWDAWNWNGSCGP